VQPTGEIIVCFNSWSNSPAPKVEFHMKMVQIQTHAHDVSIKSSGANNYIRCLKSTNVSAVDGFSL